MKKFLIIIPLLFFSFNEIAFCATAKANNRYGVRLGKKKKFNSAVKQFNKAISKYDKSSSIVYHNKGWALESMGKYNEAIKSYKEAWNRSPSQIASGEKLGYLYFLTEDYENAVLVGEKILKKKPTNKNVTKWLPDAYLKRLQQREKDKLAKKKATKKKKIEEKKIKEKIKKIKEQRLIFATFDFMYRTGYYFAGKGGGFDFFIKDEGAIVDIPESLYVEFTPRKEWEFRMILENPYLGGHTPNIITHNETFEGVYKLGNYMLGLGFTFNHLNGNINFGKDLSLFDLKLGMIFGYTKDKMKMRFSFYPRFIPHDGESSSDYTLDYDMLKMEYSYSINSNLSYHSTISARDYYIYDHTNVVSNYFGVYEFGIGMSLGNLDDKSKKIPLRFTIGFTEKFFLRDIGNNEPYDYINGQGFFGINTSGWLKGSPFSGFYALSHAVSIKGEERINEMLFLYQKIIFEMGDLRKDHHELVFQIGAGATY